MTKFIYATKIYSDQRFNYLSMEEKKRGWKIKKFKGIIGYSQNLSDVF